MYRLIYTSRTITSVDRNVMEQIAYLSAGRNDTKNITGMLIYSGDIILQVLEGDQAVVENIYTNICRDTRHYEVTVIAEGAAPRREFPDTPMGFKVVKCKDKHSIVNALADDSPLMPQTSGDRMFA